MDITLLRCDRDVFHTEPLHLNLRKSYTYLVDNYSSDPFKLRSGVFHDGRGIILNFFCVKNFTTELPLRSVRPDLEDRVTDFKNTLASIYNI